MGAWDARSDAAWSAFARRWLVETAWAAWEARSEAWAAWEARSEAAWAAACQALVGGGGLGGFGCLGSTIGGGLGGLEGGQSSWELASLCWYRYGGSRASQPVLAQVRWPRCLLDLLNLFKTFGRPTKEAFVLRTDAAFTAMGAWDARSEAAWAAACQAWVGGGGLGGLGSTF